MLYTLNFIDLFAGAGGLSEGFIRAGYTPLAHIKMNNYACDTIKTRAAFHWLKTNNQLQKYKKYIYEKQEKEDDSKLWEQVPKEVIDTVIRSEIGEKTINYRCHKSIYQSGSFWSGIEIWFLKSQGK